MAVEAIIGTIPLLGDLFDAGWRANTRNVSLIERHLEDPSRAARSGTRWLWTLAVVIGATLLLLVGAAAWLTILLLRTLGFG